MIKIIDIDYFVKGLKPVTTTDYTVGKTDKFHPEGLFSELIFGGKDSPDRNKNFSYIDLNCKVLHPALVSVLSRLNKKLLFAINKQKSYKIVDGELVEDPDGEVNGMIYVMDHFSELINKNEEGIRKDFKNMLLAYHKKNMVFIDKCLVIPAGFRDAVLDEVQGGLRVNPLNEYYLNIIKLSVQLQSFSVDNSFSMVSPIYEILSAKMQNYMDELYDYIIKKVSKKQGLVRQNILGKRADFTGRAVISGGASEIRVDELGIPFKILVKLYEPFVLHDIKNSGNVDQKKISDLMKDYNGAIYSVPSVRSLLTEIYKGHKLPKELENIIRGSVERSIADKVVLAKRDPSLHAESVQGFKPKMIDGNTIKLPIAKCGAFNADFDGDQMAIYTPVTKEAIEEARKFMISSDSKDGMGQLSDEFSKDIVIGLYSLTRDSKSKDAPKRIKDETLLETMKPTDLILYDGSVTTVGRVLFNKILPSKKYYINEPVNKKKINSLASQIYNDYKEKDVQKYVEFMHKAVDIGMKYFTINPQTFSLDDLIIPKEISDLKPQLVGKTPDQAEKIIQQMEKLLIQHLKDTESPLSVIGEAGGLKGGYSQVRQILVAKGLVQSLDGDTRAINKSYSDGFTPVEYFESGFGSRSGIADRVLNTAETGYLSRQLVYALQRVEADPRILDCKTNKTFRIKVTDDIASRLKGRNIVDNGKIIKFDEKKHNGQVINLRSPLYCTSEKMCLTCYGDLLMKNKTKYVGVLAGQIFGERLTQTIMRTFHVGGAVSIKTIDIRNEISRILNVTDKNILYKNFEQVDSVLKSKINGQIVIDKEHYLNQKKDLNITTDKIEMAYAYMKLMYTGYDIDVTIDSKSVIDLSDKKVGYNGSKIIISFEAGSNVIDCLPTAEVFREQVKVIKALLSGKSPWKNSDHFAMKIYDIYNGLTSADLVHFEVLASNLLRDSGNPSYPARLNPNYNPTVHSIKKIPQLESWLQSFNFEDPKKSISVGLLYDRPKEETILEKLVTGNFN